MERVKLDSARWLPLARQFGVASRGGHEIIRVQLHRHITADAPELRELLEEWDGQAYVHEDEDGVELVLTRSPEPSRPRWWLHGVLFALTLVTTHMAGAFLLVADPFRTSFLTLGPLVIPYPTDFSLLLTGAPFAVPFVAILLAHEMGHYLMARRHAVSVTPPFFIPFPAYYSLIGSLGAFIRIKGPMVRRSILMDVGAAGPIASFVLAVPVALVGLSLSESIAGPAALSAPYLIHFADQPIWIGNGLVFHWLASLVLVDPVAASPVVLHPLAFAGWLGFFVTALNLLPLGQLDGGHVLYALNPGLQVRSGRLFLLALLPLGLIWWGWWPWAVVIFLINRGRMAHPPVLQERAPIDRIRLALGLACVILFFLTFSPVPLRLSV